MKARSMVIAVGLLMLAAPLAAQEPGNMSPEERARFMAEREAGFEAEIQMENVLAPLNSVWIEELTWIEIRDAMAAGKTTAIISTGGIEQNGPYVAMGKHNDVLQGACEGIARELGNALCRSSSSCLRATSSRGPGTCGIPAHSRFATRPSR